MIIKSTHLILFFWLFSPGQLGATWRDHQIQDSCKTVTWLNPPKKMATWIPLPKNLISNISRVFSDNLFLGGGHTIKMASSVIIFQRWPAFRERICSPHLENSLLTMFQSSRLSPKFLGCTTGKTKHSLPGNERRGENIGSHQFQVPAVGFFGGSGPDLSFISRSRLISKLKQKSPAKIKCFLHIDLLMQKNGMVADVGQSHSSHGQSGSHHLTRLDSSNRNSVA